MKYGDTVLVTWYDGEKEKGVYLRDERGYMIIQTSPNKELACLPSCLDTIEVIENEKA